MPQNPCALKNIGVAVADQIKILLNTNEGESWT
jgi:hypothetical protein